MSNNKLDPIKRQIKDEFGFLFDKGFIISDASYNDNLFGNWKVVLESPICVIMIANSRNQILLDLIPVEIKDRKYQFSLESMIYFLSKEQKIIEPYEGKFSRVKTKQFERLALLLKEYYDQITPFLGADFEKNKMELIMAQNKYSELNSERHNEEYTMGIQGQVNNRRAFEKSIFVFVGGVLIWAFLLYKVTKEINISLLLFGIFLEVLFSMGVFIIASRQRK